MHGPPFNTRGGLVSVMTGLLGKAAKCRKNYLSSWAMIVCRFINAVRGQAMQERGEGRVIFIASEGGKSHVDGLSIYNSMKSAVIGLTRNLSHEFAGTRVSFVAVLPGAMLTDSVIERMCALPDGANYPIAQVISRIPARRGSLPEEVANKVGFLATEAGAYVQAACVSVGGGLTSW